MQLSKQDGTMPEELPTPEKSLKQLEKENKKSLKKVLTTVKSCDRIHLVAEVIRKRQTNK